MSADRGRAVRGRGRPDRRRRASRPPPTSSATPSSTTRSGPRSGRAAGRPPPVRQPRLVRRHPRRARVGHGARIRGRPRRVGRRRRQRRLRARHAGRCPTDALVYELGWLARRRPAAGRCAASATTGRCAPTTSSHPHMYLWFLGVDPARHGRGVGRALLAELHADVGRARGPDLPGDGDPRRTSASTSGTATRWWARSRCRAAAPMWRMERPAGYARWRAPSPRPAPARAPPPPR